MELVEDKREVRRQPKWVESGGGTHRERADGGVAALNPAFLLADSGGGVVKWHREVTKATAGARFRRLSHGRRRG
jgi:hypothetical protein